MYYIATLKLQWSSMWCTNASKNGSDYERYGEKYEANFISGSSATLYYAALLYKRIY